MSASSGTLFVSQVAPPQPGLRAAPGQFLLATPPTYDLYLPRVVWPFYLHDGQVESVLLPPDAEKWARTEQLELRGPYGQPFTLPSPSRRALVLTADPLAGAQLAPLVHALIARDCEVAVLTEPSPLMERWLPPEVEFRQVQAPLAAAAELWNWPDALYACGSPVFYDSLYAEVRRARLRLDRGWAQLLVRDLPMPCGIGVCYLCACQTRRGMRLNCQEGPVMDLADWSSPG